MLMGIAAVIVICILYYRWKQIPKFEVEVLQDDTWFVNRDEKRRIAMVVSLKMTNKTGAPVHMRKCKLSGYSPKENPEPITLQGVDVDKTVPIDFPSYDPYYAGAKYLVKPYATQQIWLYYESRSVTMTNLIKAPIVIKDANHKRKSIQIRIPRNMEQITIYREAASSW